jgi:phosphopantetheinyl transferase
MQHRVPTILRLNLPLAPAELRASIESLPTSQQKRAQGMKPKRQAEYVGGRGLIMSYVRALDAQSFTLLERENLGPELTVDEIMIHVSISHTNHQVVAVFSESKVGVDIETVRLNWSLEKVRLFCCRQEIEAGLALGLVEQQNEFFTRCWVRKEAFCKYHAVSVLDPKIRSANLLHDELVYDFTLLATSDTAEKHVGALYGVGGAEPEFGPHWG